MIESDIKKNQKRVVHCDKKGASKNSWHTYLDDAEQVFVFIHGFFSNGTDCWTAKDGTYWPDLISSDVRCGKSGVFVIEYHTNPTAGNLGIADCAKTILNTLQTPGRNNERPVISYSKIIFVGHSMGGLIVKYLLESNSGIFLKKEIGVVLMASPAMGSGYADFFKIIQAILKSRQMKELQPSNELLKDLDQRFKQIVSGPTRWRSLYGAEAVEHKSLMWPLKPVVSAESASRYFGSRTIVSGTNHSSIVKPKNIDAESHIFLVNFCINSLKITPKKAMLTSNFSTKIDTNFPAKSVHLEDVLFDIYTQRNDAYYAVRDADAAMMGILHLKSVWIHGISGVGKTSIVRRTVAVRGCNPASVYLANCTASATQTELLREFAYACGLQITDTQTDGELHNRLAMHFVQRAPESDVVLYIDEVPQQTSDEGMAPLVRLIASLLTTTKSMSKDCHVRFIVSSITKPNLNLAQNPLQFLEHLKPLELNKWSEQEIHKLIELLLIYMPAMRLTQQQTEEITKLSDGLPRYVKNFFRIAATYPRSAFDAWIRMTNLEHTEVVNA